MHVLCSFDAPGPRTLREVAMTFLTFSEDELLGEIRADPNQTAFIYDLYAFAEKYAQELTDWAQVMLEVRERARVVSERVKQEMPGIGFSPESYPRIDIGMSGNA